MNPNLLFVYGKLRRTAPSPMRELVDQNLPLVSQAYARGYVYDIGGYPGLKFNLNGQKVWGEVLRLPDDPRPILEALDRYERFESGYHEPYEYVRQVKKVFNVETGEPIEVWVYEYNWPVQGKLAIASGDWLKHIGLR